MRKGLGLDGWYVLGMGTYLFCTLLSKIKSKNQNKVEEAFQKNLSREPHGTIKKDMHKFGEYFEDSVKTVYEHVLLQSTKLKQLEEIYNKNLRRFDCYSDLKDGSTGNDTVDCFVLKEKIRKKLEAAERKE